VRGPPPAMCEPLKETPHGEAVEPVPARTRLGERLSRIRERIIASGERQLCPPDPIEAIKFRMEQQGLTRRDLEDIIGTRTRVAEVLNRKRGLSIAMIRRLHQRLGISADVLIRPSRGIAA
jgi:HTH-type transcriptional regulator / antitoxin HigA